VTVCAGRGGGVVGVGPAVHARPGCETEYGENDGGKTRAPRNPSSTDPPAARARGLMGGRVTE